MTHGRRRASRRAFTRFFVERGHVAVPSASLIPHDPTRAVHDRRHGPVQAVLPRRGDARRARGRRPSSTCFRAPTTSSSSGAPPATARFFEMLGNFSFGDYFKDEAIPFAWELVDRGASASTATGSGSRCTSRDDEAAAIWHDAIGLPAERIQRMGEDNFWEMGETGPCGPCSEIYFDRGEPSAPTAARRTAARSATSRSGTSSSCSSTASATARSSELPQQEHRHRRGPRADPRAPAGRRLDLRDRRASPPIVDGRRVAHRRHATGATSATDVALRRIADHARAMTFLISDGVFPTNEGRATCCAGSSAARCCGAAPRRCDDASITPRSSTRRSRRSADAYPDWSATRPHRHGARARGGAFGRTLRAGLGLLDEALGARRVARSHVLPASVAFRLHDTYGFPIELTVEIAAERGVAVDREGFDADMARAARARPRGRPRAAAPPTSPPTARSLDAEGPTQFVGRDAAATTRSTSRVRRRARGHRRR